MTSSTTLRTFAFTFGSAFAVLYPIAIKLDLALFTVYPALGIVLLGTHHSYDSNAPALAFVNPAMYWYGWMGTAAVGALVIGFIAVLLPQHASRGARSGLIWVLAVAGAAACVYLTIPWFRV